MGFERKGDSLYDVMNNLRDDVPGLVLSSDIVLPEEQKEGLGKIFRENVSKKKFATDEEREQYGKQMKDLIEKIVVMLHDPKLGDKSGTITLAQSSGGSKDNARSLFGAKNTPFAIIQVNGIAILEAIGEADNATFVGQIDDQFKENVKVMGRNEIVNRGILCRVTHQNAEAGEYDFSSNHITELIQYAIDYPEATKEVIQKQCEKNNTKAMQAVEEGKTLDTISASSCRLKTFKGYMGVAISNSAAERVGITKDNAKEAVAVMGKDGQENTKEREE